MKMTKEDKKMLIAEYEKANGYLAKHAERYVGYISGFVFVEGCIVAASKPSIETTFWFPEHGYDWDEVSATCKKASESEEYFISENLRNCDASKKLALLDDAQFVPILLRQIVRDQPADCRLATIYFKKPWEIDEDDYPLPEAARSIYRDFLVAELDKFEKRLRTYLKRYGLTKCYFSTYWADR